MKPNVLVIMCDQLRQDVVYHDWQPYVRTPNLDRLREESVTFDNSFAVFPVCGPSRASTLTGKYPHQINHFTNRNDEAVPPEERTMGHHFAEHGYDSVAFGKTHNMNPGFRSVMYDGRTSEHEVSKESTYASKWFGSANHGHHGDSSSIVGTFNGPEAEFCDFRATEQFCEYLSQRDRSTPFLAFLGIYSPHNPLYPPQRFYDLYDPDGITLDPLPEDELANRPARKQGPSRDRWEPHPDDVKRRIIATYLGMVTLIDECVGRVRDALEKEGVLDDTVIVFTSDHGDDLGDHNMAGKMGNLYDSVLRVPLIVRSPGGVSGGERRGDLVELLDLYPTLCDLCDVSHPPEPHELYGRSLVDVLSDREQRLGRERVHCMMQQARAVRTAKWKLVYNADDLCELYDLETDPGERHNLLTGGRLFCDPATREVQQELLTAILEHLTLVHRSSFNRATLNYFG